MRRQEEALRNAALSARLRTESQEERRLHKLYASTLKASRDIETLTDQNKHCHRFRRFALLLMTFDRFALLRVTFALFS